MGNWTDWEKAEDIVNALYERQGNLNQLLLDFAGEDAVQKSKLLFDILYMLKDDQEQEKKWNKLLDVYQQQQLMMAEARLLSGGLMDAKPEKVIDILERLNPERWAKKPRATKNKDDDNPYEKHLKRG